AGFPPGVVNIVPGYGPRAGSALVRHPDVDKITFTGSNRVGKEIVRAAGDDFKRVTLELGGKSPNIVFPDADLDAVAGGVMMSIFFNQGEACSAGPGWYFHRAGYGDALEAAVKKARTIC